VLAAQLSGLGTNATRPTPRIAARTVYGHNGGVKVVVAPNALKGSLSPFEAAAAMARGVKRAVPDAGVVELGIADGGDGTAEVMARAGGGTFREVLAQDPLGRVRPARYAWLSDDTAVIDVATASGLALLEENERNGLTASSYGTGELMRAALSAGATRIVLGVGGSATVDGGAGILQALGARLLDEQGRDLDRGGAELLRLAHVDLSQLAPRARDVRLEIACDVDNPLLGEHGAVPVFGPQKGVTPEGAELLERALTQFALVVERDFGSKISQVARGGAAGGIAAGLCGVLGAELLPGVDVVLDAVGFDQALAGASLCLTAEGLLDRQSLRNKGPFGVARRANKYGVPVVALSGGIAPDVTERDFPELAAMFSICPGPMTLAEAMRDAARLLEAATTQVARLFVTGLDRRE
jgi:glycerate 2-kinase